MTIISDITSESRVDKEKGQNFKKVMETMNVQCRTELYSRK